MSEPDVYTDSDAMPWGKWEGTLLKNIPPGYWEQIVAASWRGKYPRLVEYATRRQAARAVHIARAEAANQKLMAKNRRGQ